MIGSVSFHPVSPVAPAHEAPVATTQGSTLQSSPDEATISSSGSALSKLQALAESDPAKLQSALTHVARDLHAGAQQATGARADALTELGHRFTMAAISGDVSPLGAAPDQGLLGNVLAQMDKAMGMNPPPFGPWFTQ